MSKILKGKREKRSEIIFLVKVITLMEYGIYWMLSTMMDTTE